MPKEALSAQRRGRLGGDRYVICIGAGIGKGLFPDWFELARRVCCRAFGKSWDALQFDAMVKESRWSLDSWIQAAENQFTTTGRPGTFIQLLAECLYEDIVADFGKDGLQEAIVLALHHPDRLTKDQVEGINAVLTGRLRATTVMQLADALLAAEEANHLPEAIITFNADSFLYAALCVRRKILIWKKGRTGENPLGAYNRVFRGIDFSGRQTPIVHCHGAMLPPLPLSLGLKEYRIAPQRLVFSESSYLRVAAEMSSWATTMFLYYAQTCRVLFLGLSMSDPNLRRWLGWANVGTLGELADFTSVTTLTPRHVLLVKRTTNPDFEVAQEVGLRHLGVEVDTIPDWDKLGDGVRNLIAV